MKDVRQWDDRGTGGHSRALPFRPPTVRARMNGGFNGWRRHRFLDRKDPAYRAWREEERTREREKDMGKQGEALAHGLALGQGAPPMCDCASWGATRTRQ